jgi:hypothetical protein
MYWLGYPTSLCTGWEILHLNVLAKIPYISIGFVGIATSLCTGRDTYISIVLVEIAVDLG